MRNQGVVRIRPATASEAEARKAAQTAWHDQVVAMTGDPNARCFACPKCLGR